MQELGRHESGTLAGTDPESVHQLRVTVRRLRTLLRIYRRELGPGTAAGLRSELGWIARVVGAARDLDVIQERIRRDLQQVQADETTSARILSVLAERRREVQENLMADFQSDRYRELRRRLDELAGEIPAKLGRAERQRERRVTRRHCQKAIARVLLWWNADEATLVDAALHRMRVDLKQLRYTCEASPELKTAKARSLRRHVVTMLDCLGAHQDAIVGQERLSGLAAELRDSMPQDRNTLMVMGSLIQLERQRAADARNEFSRLWPKLLVGLKRLRRALD
jgi:CHAD domain-containing protein